MAHKMLEGIDAVIFDMDGTLVDSMWIWRSVDIEYLGRFGIELPENLQSQIEGKSFDETAEFFKKIFSIPDTIEQIKAEWNRMAGDKYLHEVPLKPGVTDFLEGCRRNRIQLGIATSNSRELVEKVAGVHQLDSYFASIVTGCDVKRGKPSPDIYLEAARQLAVPPGRCLVFEDIVPGIQAGLNAGMRVCAVEDEYSVRDRARKRQLADFYIQDFFELF